MARIVRITWEELQVHQSESYGITGEAGSSAEWRVYLVVKIDGKERRWERFERSGIRDNRTYKVDREIDVALDGELSIEVMASELDDSSDDDHIPGFSRTHAPEAGWETGGTRYRKGRGSLDFDYTIQYRIQYISEGATLTPGKGQIFDVRYSGLWDASSERWFTRSAGRPPRCMRRPPSSGRSAAVSPNCNRMCSATTSATTSSGRSAASASFGASTATKRTFAGRPTRPGAGRDRMQ